MKKIRILCVGKVKEQYLRNQITEIMKKIRSSNRKYELEIVEVMDESIPKTVSDTVIDNIKYKEGVKLLDKIGKTDYVICLCIDGKPTSSAKMKMLVDKAFDSQKEVIDFVIGGSLGLHETVVSRANYKMSISNMTFPHQLIRVVLLEQFSKI